MKKKDYLFVLLLIVLLLMSSCTESINQTNLTQEITKTIPPTALPSPTLTQQPTSTPTPTIVPPTPIPTITINVGNVPCQGGEKIIALLINPDVIDGIRQNLTRFENDLCKSNYSVIEFPIESENPVEIRDYLIYFYEQTNERLIGTILIGEFPRAYQYYVVEYANPNIPSTKSEVISYQYYADLNGKFDKSENFVSLYQHEYAFDIHDDDLDWEIWVGLLPTYKGDTNLTIEAINRYLEKNHSYRSGEYSIPYNLLQVSEHFTGNTEEEYNEIRNNLINGQYAYLPLSARPNAYLYFDSAYANMTVWDGYDLLSKSVANVFIGDAHGVPTSHGRLSVQWIETYPIETVLFWSTACSVGNLDIPNNFLTSVLYSPTSTVITAIGTTNESGGMGTNINGFFGKNILTSIDEGNSIGDAIISHVNVPLIYPWDQMRETHYAVQVILGDPSIILNP